jgi:lipase chaperone LimK
VDQHLKAAKHKQGTDGDDGKMIREIDERYIIAGAILAAIVIGAGSAYMLHASHDDLAADGTIRSSAQHDAAKPLADFVIGPGYTSFSLLQQIAEPAAKSPFRADKAGKLLMDQDTENALDSLLAMLPAEPSRTDLQNIEEAARAGLPDKAADKAAALLRQYIIYREEISKLPGQPEPNDPAEEREAYDKKVAYLRSRHFDMPTSEALFGIREAQRIYSAQVLRVVSNNALSATEKEQQLKALHEALPQKVAALEFNGAEFSAELEEQVALLRVNHASDEDVKNLRHQYFGLEVAPSPDGSAADR